MPREIKFKVYHEIYGMSESFYLGMKLVTFNDCSTYHELCNLIDMEREDLHFWDELGIAQCDKNTEEHLIGTSAVQFITTSNIVIHTLDVMKRVYLNIFSCKDFNSTIARKFCKDYFKGKIVTCQTIRRK